MTPPARDAGYAMIAALIGMLAFAAVAFELTAQGRGAITGADAELTQARLDAAADAGLVLALVGLAETDLRRRYAIDGRTRLATFDGLALSIAIEDERGKVPINVISEREASRMFAAAGVPPSQQRALVNAFLDWRDDDEEARRLGAETPFYAARGYRSRDGDLRSIEELNSIEGITPEIYARLAPAVTLFFGESGGFSERNAQPLALAAMLDGAADGPQVIQRRRELAGQRPAIDLDRRGTETLTGRPLTIRVTARDGRGGALTRATLVELTGNPRDHVWVRARE